MYFLARMLYEKLLRLARSAPQGAISLSGILGLAILLVGFYQLRNGNRSPPRSPQPTRPAASQAQQSSQDRRQQQGSQQQGPSSTAAGSSLASPTPASSAPVLPASRQQQPPQSKADAIPVPASVRSRLSGIKKITISAPGVLLQEAQAHELSDSATVKEEELPLLQQLMSVCDVYLLAHVMDDVGQAAVTGALEASGVLGTKPGSIRPHRLLFCSTLEGKVSMVRQLEPDLHVDCHASTVYDLQRFIPSLLYTPQPVQQTSSKEFSSNVLLYTSLKDFFTS